MSKISEKSTIAYLKQQRNLLRTVGIMFEDTLSNRGSEHDRLSHVQTVTSFYGLISPGAGAP